MYAHMFLTPVNVMYILRIVHIDLQYVVLRQKP